MNLSYEEARELRRRHRHERQAVLFGGMVAGMAVVALGATAVYTGVVDAPFARDFTTVGPETPELAAPPCPPEGTEPTWYSQAQVRVLNGTSRAGLAGQVAGELAARGFTVLGTGNSPVASPVVAEVHFGEAGLAQAYTIGAQIEGAALLLDSRPDPTVDLILGNGYLELREPGEVPLAPETPLEPAPDCIPLEQAVQVALPPITSGTGGSEGGEPAEGEAPAEGEEPVEGEAPAEG